MPNAERTKLADQLNELGAAERVLTRFGRKADTAEKVRKIRPAKTAAGATVSLSDTTLQAVQAHGLRLKKSSAISHGNSE
jgi:hypothetical protein